MTPGTDRSATSWGRIDDDGTVYVRTSAGERSVGSWQAGDPQAGLEHFARRYADLVTEVELLEQRLASGAGDPAATGKHARDLRKGLPTASVVGDLDALDQRLERLIESARGRADARAADRTAARERAVAAKEALVVEAEGLATHDSGWKTTGDRFRTIVDEWREIKGVDRRTDEALWKRLRTARDTFTRQRGAHFAALDVERDAVREHKERLITEAESLAESSDWGPTASRLKALMREWKDAGRAAKSVDDALWKRFRAAQDTFFGRRAEQLRARDAEKLDNQRTREALIGEAEALDPDRDRQGARAALRRIQERYDAVGPAPRESARALDDRMRAAEERVRAAADERAQVTASNPLLDQMRQAVEKAENAVTRARAAGDDRRVAETEAALAARRDWLAEAERTTSR